jgi:hypothetical protein
MAPRFRREGGQVSEQGLYPNPIDWKFPLKVVRGVEGFQLKDSTGRMICDGMTSRDAANLLYIVSEFFKRPQ